MPDDSTVLLSRARQESGHIDESDERDVERIAEAHEAGRFDGCIDIETAGSDFRLIGDDADWLAVHASESDEDILGERGHDLAELSVIYYVVDDVEHIVGSGGF